MEPPTTATKTIVELINARPIFASSNAFTKFLTSHFEGNIITEVEAYSSALLKAVIKQENNGTSVQNAKKTKIQYLKKFVITDDVDGVINVPLIKSIIENEVLTRL